MPSALPSSPSYYQDHHGIHEKWNNLEFEDSVLKKTLYEKMSSEAEVGSRLEIAADGQMHSLGEDIV